MAYGKCARCNLERIHESFSRCPNCQYSLGRSSLFGHYDFSFFGHSVISDPSEPQEEAKPTDGNKSDRSKSGLKKHQSAPALFSSNTRFSSKLTPPELTDFCFVNFECKFEHRLGCKIYGNGPVVIEWVEDMRMKMSSGVLKSLQGNYTNVLIGRGLSPSIGDIIVAVGEMNVEHLTALEVSILSLPLTYHSLRSQRLSNASSGCYLSDKI